MMRLDDDDDASKPNGVEKMPRARTSLGNLRLLLLVARRLHRLRFFLLLLLGVGAFESKEEASVAHVFL